MGETDQAQLDRKALEAFVVENADLERLEALLDRFNIFEAIGVVRQELRHSDFLAFLLDPQESHGLGDAVVKRLLQRALISERDAPVPVTPIELSLWNLSQMVVLREWHHIDIFLLDEQNRLAVIIENKIDTGEHSDQLPRYYEIVKRHYPGYKLMPVYLTPGGEEPSHKDYLPLGYSTVCEVLDNLFEGRASAPTPDLQTLVTHYTQMLRRHIVGDPEIAKLCRQIYREHKRALNLIYKHRPNPKVESQRLLVELISDAKDIIHKGKYKNDYLIFRPQNWDDAPTLNAGEGSSGLLKFVFHNRPYGESSGLTLYLEMSPGDERVRRKLFEMGQKDEALFNYLNDPNSSDHPKLYRRTFLTSGFYEEAIDEDREEEIRKHWAEFLEEDLPRIEAALKDERWIWQEPNGAGNAV